MGPRCRAPRWSCGPADRAVSTRPEPSPGIAGVESTSWKFDDHVVVTNPDVISRRAVAARRPPAGVPRANRTVIEELAAVRKNSSRLVSPVHACPTTSLRAQGRTGGSAPDQVAPPEAGRAAGAPRGVLALDGQARGLGQVYRRRSTTSCSGHALLVVLSPGLPRVALVHTGMRGAFLVQAVSSSMQAPGLRRRAGRSRNSSRTNSAARSATSSGSRAGHPEIAGDPVPDLRKTASTSPSSTTSATSWRGDQTATRARRSPVGADRRRPIILALTTDDLGRAHDDHQSAPTGGLRGAEDGTCASWATSVGQARHQPRTSPSSSSATAGVHAANLPQGLIASSSSSPRKSASPSSSEPDFDLDTVDDPVHRAARRDLTSASRGSRSSRPRSSGGRGPARPGPAKQPRYFVFVNALEADDAVEDGRPDASNGRSRMPCRPGAGDRRGP